MLNAMNVVRTVTPISHMEVKYLLNPVSVRQFNFFDSFNFSTRFSLNCFRSITSTVVISNSVRNSFFSNVIPFPPLFQDYTINIPIYVKRIRNWAMTCI